MGIKAKGVSRTPSALGSLIGGTLAVLLVIAGIVIVLSRGSAVPTMAEERAVPIYSVDRNDKKIALSIDAAWGAEKTVGILDILDEYDVKATFFLVGFWIDSYPERVQQIASRGHEIGNHSTTHPNMPSLSPSDMLLEIKTCESKIKDLTGQTTTLFRAPYGDYDNTMLSILRENGYECIQWSIDSLDWKDIGTDAIVERVIDNAESGSIILFHNNSTSVLEALPIILEKLTTDGYTVVPISELMLDSPYMIDRNGIQRAN